MLLVSDHVENKGADDEWKPPTQTGRELECQIKPKSVKGQIKQKCRDGASIIHQIIDLLNEFLIALTLLF